MATRWPSSTFFAPLAQLHTHKRPDGPRNTTNNVQTCRRKHTRVFVTMVEHRDGQEHEHLQRALRMSTRCVDRPAARQLSVRYCALSYLSSGLLHHHRTARHEHGHCQSSMCGQARERRVGSPAMAARSASMEVEPSTFQQGWLGSAPADWPPGWLQALPASLSIRN